MGHKHTFYAKYIHYQEKVAHKNNFSNDSVGPESRPNYRRSYSKKVFLLKNELS